jgi:competence protein CoiA
MAFTARHEAWGRVDATLPDLGCGQSWEVVHRARPRVAIDCPQCGHGLHAKVSPLGLRFFAHDPNAPQCTLSGESLEHHLLKLELVTWVRDAGWHGELEVQAPGGRWRADVLAVSPDGSRQVAWEAQLSAITPDEIRRRTANLHRDGVEVCWVTPTAAPWLGAAPSIQAAPVAENWLLLAGVKRLAITTEPAGQAPASMRRWELVEDITLQTFVAWVLQGRVIEHRVLQRSNLGATIWTAPHYVALERELAQIEALEAEQERERALLNRKAFSAQVQEQLKEQQIAASDAAKGEIRRALAVGHSGIAEPRRAAIQKALEAWAVAQGLTHLQIVFGAGGGAARWAGGSAVLADGHPVGTLMPSPQLLGDLVPVDALVLFATCYTEARDLAYRAADDATIVRLEGKGISAVDKVADFLVSGPSISAEVERLQREAAGTPRQPESRDSMLWAVTVLVKELRRARSDDLDSLFRVTAKFGQLVGAGLLDQEAVCRATIAFTRHAGWAPVTSYGLELDADIRQQVAAAAAYQPPPGSPRRPLLLG